MLRKEKKIPIEGLTNAFFVEEYFEDEPISENILSSINDYFNLMHLIKKSWINKKYRLRMKIQDLIFMMKIMIYLHGLELKKNLAV